MKALNHSTRFRVGYRYRCKMRFAPDATGVPVLLSDWEPRFPLRLSTKEMADYRRGRDAFVAEIAEFLGANVGVVEVGEKTPGVTVVKSPKPCGGRA